ncbi:MAG: general secretion pathway protein GspK [Bdellovibrionia bacterium]
MGFFNTIKSRSLPLTRGNPAQNPKGIALFLVLGSVAILSILVTEFTYVSQLTQSIAFGSLDQLKAHYLAKSALKLSLLRIVAYKKLQKIPIQGFVSKGLLDQIWGFPLSWPLPTVGLTRTEKDVFDQFQKSSGLDGRFTARIESESSKYNLNLLLTEYAPRPTPSATPTQSDGSPPPPPPQNLAPLTPEEAREGLRLYLGNLLQGYSEKDRDFSDRFRDLQLNDLTLQIAGWVDPRVESRNVSRFDNKIPSKKAPFYHLSELHMVPLFEDDLYQLISPSFTTSTTPGININTMREPMLRALIPGITPDEVTDFFKFRDSVAVDNKFKEVADFENYLKRGVSFFMNNPQAIQLFNDRLRQQNIRLVTTEYQFKISVEAEVMNSRRTIEAWVEIFEHGNPLLLTRFGRKNAPDLGIRITYLRIF